METESNAQETSASSANIWPWKLERQLDKQHNAAIFNQFIANPNDDGKSHTLSLSSPIEIPALETIIPRKIEHKKTFFKLSEGQNSESIALVYADHHLESYVWYTTHQHYKDALFDGLEGLEPQALTARLIHKIGEYSQVELRRLLVNHTVSNNYHAKNFVQRYTQYRIKCLQGIERLTHNYDDTQSASENLKRIQQVFKKYKEQMEAMKGNLNNLSTLNTSLPDDPDTFKKINEDKLLNTLKILGGKDHLVSQIQQDINFAQKFIGRLDALQNSYSNDESGLERYLKESLLVHYGTESTAAFIEKSGLRIIGHLKQLNQEMTYSITPRCAIMRGQLDIKATEAESMIMHYKSPLGLRVTKEHQGIFNQDSNKKIAVPFKANKKDHLLKNMEAIHCIANNRLNPDSLKCILKNNRVKKNKNPSFTETAFTQWRAQASVVSLLKKLGYFIFRLLLDVLFSPFDLLIGFTTKTVGYHFPTYEKRRFKIKKSVLKCFSSKHISVLPKPLEKELEILQKPIGEKIGELIGTITKNILLSVWYTLVALVKMGGYELPKACQNIYYDVLFGHSRRIFCPKAKNHDCFTLDEKSESIKTIEWETLDKCIGDLYALQVTQSQTSNNTANKAETEEKYSEPCLTLAVPPYPLTPPQYNDITNKSLEGTSTFIRAFTHIHEKHSVAGWVFNVMYTAGGLFVLTPKLCLGLLKGPAFKQYAHSSQKMGYAMASGKTSAAISSACTQAQLSAAFLEFWINGETSWLVTLMKKLVDNPSELIALFTIASVTGYGLSSHIKMFAQELGTIPMLSYPIVGFKIPLISLQLIKTPNKNTEEYKRKLDELKAQLEKWMHQIQPKSSDDGVKNNNNDTNQDNIENTVNIIIDAIKNAEDEKALCNIICEKLTLFASNNPISKDNIDRQRITFLIKFNQISSVAKHLPEKEKRQLLRLAQQLFQGKDHAHFINTLRHILYQSDEENQSIIVTTLMIPFKYLLLIFRLLMATLIAWRPEPAFTALTDQLKRDGTRLLNAFCTLCGILYSFLRIMSMALYDVIANKIFARIVCAIKSAIAHCRGKEPTVTKCAKGIYDGAININKGCHHLKLKSSQLLGELKTTIPRPCMTTSIISKQIDHEVCLSSQNTAK